MSTVIHVDGITKRYGHVPVLSGARASFAEGQKIGVIGRNGAGKSTLFRILVGEEEPDEGQVVRRPGARLGYLEQLPPYRPEETVIAFLGRYSGKPSWDCAKMASRFAVKNDLHATPIGGLSEGYRMRVRLAGMMLRDPDFLLMDEPTNYLDLHTLLLLERFLETFRGGWLIISHDREFLKRTCTETLEVERGSLTQYPGGIEAYLEHKEKRLEQAENENRKIDAKKRHLQTFVDRFRYKASKASQAQSKLKQIARLHSIEIAHPMSGVEIRIPTEKIKKGVAVRMEGLSIGYPGKVVAAGVTLDLERGRHVAILGDNGAGKTTLLRTLAGSLAPIAGEYRWGPDLTVAYYGQAVFDAMDPYDRVDAYLTRMAAPGVTTEEVLEMAGNFLFRDKDVEKRVENLSGGERSRLCLAGLLLSRCTVFLLDEPTNHLDFETVEALGLALREHPGTVLFVSHNRTFVNLVATAVLEVKDGTVRNFPGTYEEYVWRLSKEIDEDVPKIGPQAKPAATAAPADAEKRERKEAREEVREQKKKQKKIELAVAALEDERTSILAQMALNPTVHSPGLNKRLAEVSKEIESSEKEWFDIQQGIDWLEKE